MAMKTELTIVDHVVVGGEKMQVHLYELNNTHLHQVAEVASRLQLALMEMDSNNSSGVFIAHDSQSVASEWARLLAEWKLAKKWRNLAPVAQEKLNKILVLTDNELKRTINVKARRAVHALMSLLWKVVHSDSAKLQYGLGAADIKKIEEQLEYTSEVLKVYIGSGELVEGATAEDPVTDTGNAVAAFEFLGTVVPPLNLHSVESSEPSADAPRGPLPDFADTESTVPLPNAPVGRK